MTSIGFPVSLNQYSAFSMNSEQIFHGKQAIIMQEGKDITGCTTSPVITDETGTFLTCLPYYRKRINYTGERFVNLLLFISGSIFACTLILVFTKPRGLGIGYSALVGGAVSVLLGVTSLEDIVRVLYIVWNPTLTFIAIVIITMVFDESGFFTYAATRLEKIAHGSPIRLFILIILFGSFVSAFFANDGAALVLTPIIYWVLSSTDIPRKSYLPYIMAVGFIADTASLPFVISNLTNILATSFFDIHFLQYAEAMIIPDAVAVLTSLAVLLAMYGKSLPESFTTVKNVNQQDAIKDRRIFSMALPVLGILAVIYSIGGIYSIPVAIFAFPGSLIILLIAWQGKKIDTKKILKESPWQIILFSIGMYVIVYGMAEQGLAAMAAGVLIDVSAFPGPLNLVFSGYFMSALAAVMNNLPSIMLGNLAIRSSGLGLQYVYVNVIANDIGPKFTTIGSLATLIWIYTVKKKIGITISWRYYMGTGFLMALPVLTTTLLALWVVTII